MASEQTILASFNSPEAAEQAVKALQALGIDTWQIDRVSPSPGEPSRQVENPLTGDIPSLAHMTLGTDFSGRNASVLASADPAASGQAGAQVSGQDILLTVVCEKSLVERAVKAIRAAGGNT